MISFTVFFAMFTVASATNPPVIGNPWQTSNPSSGSKCDDPSFASSSELAFTRQLPVNDPIDPVTRMPNNYKQALFDCSDECNRRHPAGWNYIICTSQNTSGSQTNTAQCRCFPTPPLDPYQIVNQPSYTQAPSSNFQRLYYQPRNYQNNNYRPMY